MYWQDLTRLLTGALIAQRLRSFLTALGIAVGIAAVVILTSLGEGLHRFVLAEFTQFGTHLIAVNPGKSTTHGASVGVFGNVRPLTLEDSEALARIPSVIATTPVIQGNVEIESIDRSRRTTVFGVGPQATEVLQLSIGAGRFLPSEDLRAARSFAVLGSKLKQELFKTRNPLGQRISVGGQRYRVIGVMEPKGQILGFDIDDSVYIPAARALEMFNRESLMEIDVLYSENISTSTIAEKVKNALIARHGREDFTLTTQEQMLDVLGSVLDILTFAVAAIGGISLLVGGVGILTIMTIAIRDRTPEIGLLRSLGARRRQILIIFLGEAILLSAIGGISGVVIGLGSVWTISLAIPALPVHPPIFYLLLAELLAISIGLLAGVIPAQRASRLDPIESLRTE